MIEVHLMTSEVESGAGSGDDYEHKHSTFMFADGDVSNCRYYRTLCMHRRLYYNGNKTFKIKSFFETLERATMYDGCNS